MFSPGPQIVVIQNKNRIIFFFLHEKYKKIFFFKFYQTCLIENSESQIIYFLQLSHNFPNFFPQKCEYCCMSLICLEIMEWDRDANYRQELKYILCVLYTFVKNPAQSNIKPNIYRVISLLD